MKIRIPLLIIMIFILSGCSQKSIFPTDTEKYDCVANYKYEYKEHKFHSEDNTTLYGLHIKTPRSSKGLIVLANGMYQNMSIRFTYWLWAIDAGYDLFIFDYRGYGKSHGEADMFGFRDDVTAALEYAHTLDEDKPIVLVGQSMGGTFVIDALALKEYDYVSLAVIDSTFITFSSVMSSFMLRSVILIPFSWLPYIVTPDELNSIDNIQKVTVPILFISGDEDRIVDHGNTRDLYDKSTAEKSIWIVKDAGHVKSFNHLQVQEDFLKILSNGKLDTNNKERYFN